jgi:hypothetical protein
MAANRGRSYGRGTGVPRLLAAAFACAACFSG